MRFHLALALLGFACAMPHPSVDETAAVARDQCPRSSVDEALLAIRNDPSLALRDIELDTRDPGDLEKRVCCTRCPGKCTAPQRVAPVSKGNGCGPAGWWNKVIPEYIFGPCCNQHDICYTQCGNSRVTCDSAFLPCMVSKCTDRYGGWDPRRYICVDLATKYYVGVRAAGCPAFIGASKRHCKC